MSIVNTYSRLILITQYWSYVTLATLREAEQHWIKNRSDLTLSAVEGVDIPNAMNYVTGGDKSGDIFGVVVAIDKTSDEGYVQLMNGKLIPTGPNEDGYECIIIPADQGFVTYGSSAVLYVHRK
ncbi:hypothetical protein EYC80_001005 [Monilinia laxa]|uniref:Uncharacterized protein n=1 Tax=Monilinia laxa TaxID=61186 RepID=A0A5N6K801_MONLA|nr:hypothetical protein EYC80_001005 [Monilinia laxa]